MGEDHISARTISTVYYMQTSVILMIRISFENAVATFFDAAQKLLLLFIRKAHLSTLAITALYVLW